MDHILLSLATVLLVAVLYLYTVAVVTARFPGLRNKRICLLTAHPDDEAMFFAPTVLALTRPEAGNYVTILCLSSGNAEGLGETRKRELVESGLVLGLKREEDVFVVDKPTDFPDSMTTHWSAEKISALLRETFELKPTSTSKSHSKSPLSDAPLETTIDILITFDSHGVSSHPNHISLYHGARAFVLSLIQNKPGWEPPIDLYTLTSVKLFRKYTGLLDVFVTLGATTLAVWRSKRRSKVDSRKHPACLLFMHGLGKGGWATGWEAMTVAHASQMVWFRYGWIMLSRYMFMNDLRLEKV